MNKSFPGLAMISAVILAACATPRVAGNAALAKWAAHYGYEPYTLRGKAAYCHYSVGSSGSFCVPSTAMANLMAKHEAPPIPRNTGVVEGDLQAGR